MPRLTAAAVLVVIALVWLLAPREPEDSVELTPLAGTEALMALTSSVVPPVLDTV